MKIAFVGGHVTPAVATIEAMQRFDAQIEIVFIGRKHTREGDSAIAPEYTLITERKIPYYVINTGRFYRSYNKYFFKSLLKIPWGFVQAYRHLRRVKPDVIVCFGSYVAVPVAIAGWVLKIRVISHEQVLMPGLANRVVSRFASLMALSFEDTRRFYRHVRTVVTGNPVRKDLLDVQEPYGVKNPHIPTVFVTGGNQGSHTINSAIFDALPELLKICNVIHQTGNSKVFNDFEKGKALQSQVSSEMGGGYVVFDYIDAKGIGSIYARADVVVSRAGINTICELLLLGKKSLLIPLPATHHGEQIYNAQFFEKTGLGMVLKQEEITKNVLVSTIEKLFSLDVPVSSREKARALVPPNADERLVYAILSAIPVW